MRIISEENLPFFFGRKPDLLPEVISRLIRESVPSSSQRIPKDSSTQGPDGKIHLESEYSGILPQGTSYLEMSIQKDNIRRKADEDFEKYMNGTEIPCHEMKTSSFIFITSSKFGKRDQWMAEKTNTKLWNDVIVIDAAVLADWLEKSPAIALWLLGDSNSGRSNQLLLPEKHWHSMVKRAKQLELPPELFLSSERHGIIEKVWSYLYSQNHSGESLCIYVSSSSEFEDFLSILLTNSNAGDYLDNSSEHIFTENSTSLSSIDESKDSEEIYNSTPSILDRAIILRTESAWETIFSHPSTAPHIFITSQELDLSNPESNLIQDTLEKGHYVLYWTKAQNTSEVTLDPISRRTLRGWLEKLEFHPYSIKRLLHFSDCQLWTIISIINDKKSSFSLGNREWVEENWKFLMFACLLGSWVTSDDPDIELSKDGTLIKELISQKKIEDWKSIMEKTIYQSPGILSRRHRQFIKEEKGHGMAYDCSIWSFEHRHSGFHVLGKRVNREILRLFAMHIKKVFENIGSAIKRDDLGTVHGNPQGVFSDEVILGLLQTLCYFRHFPMLFPIDCKNDLLAICNLIAETLLKENKWSDLASHRYLLPLIAEIAPETFLNELTTSIRDTSEIFYNMFSHNDNFSSFGLLRALEVLAWDKKSFKRVIHVILMLSTPPHSTVGGNNEPFKVLKKILNPFECQHTLEFEDWKKIVLELRDNDEFEPVIWKLTCSTLGILHAPTSSLPNNLTPYCAEWISCTQKNRVDLNQLGTLKPFYFDLLLRGLSRNVHRVQDIVYLIKWIPEPIFEKLVRIVKNTSGFEENGSLFYTWNKLIDESFFLEHSNLDKKPKLAKRFSLLIGIYESKLRYLDKMFSGNWKDVFLLFLNVTHIATLQMNDTVSDDDLQKLRDKATNELYNKVGILNVVKLALLIQQPAAFGRTIGELKAIAPEDAEYVAKISFSKIIEFIKTDMISIAGSLDQTTVVNSFTGFYHGFIESYFLHNKKWEWIKQLKIDSWNESLRMQFLLVLPKKVETWECIEQNFPREKEKYWKLFELSYPIKNLNDLEIVVKNLVAVKRFVSSVIALRMSLVMYKNNFGGLFKFKYRENNPIFEDFKKSGRFKKMCTSIHSTLKSLANNESIEQSSLLPLNYAHDLINFLYNSKFLTAKQYEELECKYILPTYYFQKENIKPWYSEIRLNKCPLYFCKRVNEMYELARTPIENDLQRELLKQRHTSLYNLLHQWSTLPGASEQNYNVEEIIEWLNSVIEGAKTISNSRIESIFDTLGMVISKYPEHVWSDQRITSFMEDQANSDEIIDAFVIGLYNRYQGLLDFKKYADYMGEAGMTRIASKMQKMTISSQKTMEDLTNSGHELHRTLDDY